MVLVFRRWQPGAVQVFQKEVQAGHQKGQRQLLCQIASGHGVAHHIAHWQQEQQRRPQGRPIFRGQVKAFHRKIETYRQAQPLDQENPQPTGGNHRTQVFQPEKVRSLHIEIIPVRKLSLGHALPYQPEEGSILPCLKLQKRRCTPGAGQKEYSRRQHQQNRAGNGSEYRFFTFHSVGAPFPCRNMGLLYRKELPP